MVATRASTKCASGNTAVKFVDSSRRKLKSKALQTAETNTIKFKIFEDPHIIQEIGHTKNETCVEVPAEIMNRKNSALENNSSYFDPSSKSNEFRAICGNPNPKEETLVDVKKMGISLDEKQMNGAPEGDLFEVQLFSDSQLQPFPAEIVVSKELIRQLDIFNATTVWAEKYETLTILRRVILYHCDEALYEDLNDNICGKQKEEFLNRPLAERLLCCFLDSVASLRSSNVRNGLLALSTAMIKLPFIYRSQETINVILSGLLTRCGSGPRFLCDSAYDVALKLAKLCHSEMLSVALSSFAFHKNPEISFRALSLTSEVLLSFNSENLLEDDSQHDTLINLTANGLLSAKKALAKEKCKHALLHVKKICGEEKILCGLSLYQQSEMRRELNISSQQSSSNGDFNAFKSTNIVRSTIFKKADKVTIHESHRIPLVSKTSRINFLALPEL